MVVDTEGRHLLSRRVANDQSGLLALITAVLELGHETTWAADVTRGGAVLLLGLLANHGEPAFYLPGLAVNRATARYRGQGKTDAREAATPQPVHHQPRHPRNRHQGNGQYRPHAAHACAEARRPRPKPDKIRQNLELRDFIQCHLDIRWSPEQICQALRAQFPDRPQMHVAHETANQALYVQGRGELRRELARVLRTGRVRREPRRQAQQRTPRFE